MRLSEFIPHQKVYLHVFTIDLKNRKEQNARRYFFVHLCVKGLCSRQSPQLQTDNVFVNSDFGFAEIS